MPYLTWPGKKPPSTNRLAPPIVHEQWGPHPVHSLHCGDNLEWLQDLNSKDTKVDLIYLDPPFCSQANYEQHFDLASGRKTVSAFTDVLSVNNFLQFIYERIWFLHNLLAEKGSIFLHCDHQQSHHIRMIMDEIFGASQFRNEIIWHYTGGGRSKRYFSRKHDSIFWYSKTNDWTFNSDNIRVPYKKSSGYAKGGIRSKSGKIYKPNPKGTIPDDTWDIPMLNPLAHERTGYPTQKPQKLLDRIILAASNPEDLVMDPFMGSGTTAVSCATHNRRFIGADQNWNSLHCTQRRLLKLETELSTTYSHIKTPIIKHMNLGKDGNIIQTLDKEQHSVEFQDVRYLSSNRSWTTHWVSDVELIRIVALDGSFSDFRCNNGTWILV